MSQREREKGERGRYKWWTPERERVGGWGREGVVVETDRQTGGQRDRQTEAQKKRQKGTGILWTDRFVAK